MKNTDNYTSQIEVSAKPELVFNALNEGLDTWWGKTSKTDFKTGGHFTIQFENGYWWTFKIIEHTPNKELIWKCIDGEPEFNKEWIGHVLHWLIEEKDSKTIISFHQIGLTPDIDCYNICSSTWNRFLTKELSRHLNNEKLSTI